MARIRTKTIRLALAAAIALACANEPPPLTATSCPAIAPRPAAALPFPIDGDADRGARLFLEHCEGCHARTPARRAPGAPPSAPRLDCGSWIATVDDAYLYHAINRGPGAHGHGAEPPLGEHLVPMDVADLVAYLRSLAGD